MSTLQESRQNPQSYHIHPVRFPTDVFQGQFAGLPPGGDAGQLPQPPGAGRVR